MQRLKCDVAYMKNKSTKGLYFCILVKGAQWLSGRELDSRPRGRGLDPRSGVTALCP